MQQRNDRSRLFADDAEAALLATVLQRPEQADRVRHLPAESFGRREHGHVFAAVLEATSVPLDGEAALVAVAEVLQRDGQLLEIGGAAGLADLSNGGITAHPEVAAEEISRAAAARGIAAGLESLRANLSPAGLADAHDELKHLARMAGSGGQLSSLKVITMNDVEAEPLEWLWPDWLCCGKFHLISGQPGQGKSFALLDLAARLSNGTVWPDGSPVERPASTLLMAAEDDPADGLRPRLDAANANCSRIHLLQSCSRLDEQGRFRQQPIQIQRDFLQIARYLKLHPEIRLVILDPLVEYMTGTDSNSNEKVRAALADLLTVASEAGVAVIGVAHFRKAVSASAIDKSGGSGAFVARARVGMILIRDPEDDSRRLLLQTKNNIAEQPDGMAFTIVNGQVHWSADRITLTADEAIQPKRGPAPSARADAAGWLRDRLQDGPVESRVIDSEAERLGHSIATIKRARKSIGAESEKKDTGEGKQAWFVSLPGSVCTDGDF